MRAGSGPIYLASFSITKDPLHTAAHSLSTTFINTGIITVRFVTLAVTKVNKKGSILQKGRRKKENRIISDRGKTTLEINSQ